MSMRKHRENWLSLDLSSESGSLAVHSFGRGKILLQAELHLEDGGKHSESVLGGIQAVLNQAGISLDEVGRFLTNRGPGSFTGLRIAFATLKAFAAATGKPIEVMDGHEIAALSLLAKNPNLQEAVVATRVSKACYLVSRYQTDGCGGINRVAQELAENPGGGNLIRLQARELAERLVTSKSRRTFATPEEWAAAAPDYFGTSFSTPGQPNAQPRSEHH